jgi:Arc/MetJ-type ribon-helix-helix transcriptional regulator
MISSVDISNARTIPSSLCQIGVYLSSSQCQLIDLLISQGFFLSQSEVFRTAIFLQCLFFAKYHSSVLIKKKKFFQSVVSRWSDSSKLKAIFDHLSCSYFGLVNADIEIPFQNVPDEQVRLAILFDLINRNLSPFCDSQVSKCLPKIPSIEDQFLYFDVMINGELRTYKAPRKCPYEMPRLVLPNKIQGEEKVSKTVQLDPLNRKMIDFLVENKIFKTRSEFVTCALNNFFEAQRKLIEYMEKILVP